MLNQTTAGLRLGLAVLLFSILPLEGHTQVNGFEAYRAGKFAEAYALLMPLAQTGDAEAQYVLGLMYAGGEGVEQNFYEAGKMYRLAGDQGHAGAQVNLGSLFEECYGNGPCNVETGAHWYRRAADQGSAIGQYNLAVLYATGVGVAEDEWTAKILFRQAAEQGYLPAQYNLAVAYERGMGGPIDPVAAWAWYELSAERGFEGAGPACGRIDAGLSDAQQASARELVEIFREAYVFD